MPMGIVSNDEFEKEISNCLDRQIEVIVTEKEKAGRKEGDNNVPESLRKIIGEESVINGRASALALAKMFDVSPSSVSAYAKGATSTDTYNKPNKGLQNYLKERKDRVTKKALRVMASAMNQITEESLKGTSAKDCAAVAKDMSAIVKNMEGNKPEGREGDIQNNQFIFYAPKFMKEDAYEVIEARE